MRIRTVTLALALAACAGTPTLLQLEADNPVRAMPGEVPGFDFAVSDLPAAPDAASPMVRWTAGPPAGLRAASPAGAAEDTCTPPSVRRILTRAEATVGTAPMSFSFAVASAVRT